MEELAHLFCYLSWDWMIHVMPWICAGLVNRWSARYFRVLSRHKNKIYSSHCKLKRILNLRIYYTHLQVACQNIYSYRKLWQGQYYLVSQNLFYFTSGCAGRLHFPASLAARWATSLSSGQWNIGRSEVATSSLVPKTSSVDSTYSFHLSVSQIQSSRELWVLGDDEATNQKETWFLKNLCGT